MLTNIVTKQTHFVSLCCASHSHTLLHHSLTLFDFFSLCFFFIFLFPPLALLDVADVALQMSKKQRSCTNCHPGDRDYCIASFIWMITGVVRSLSLSLFLWLSLNLSL